MLEKSSRQQELDALRGIAALLVVLFHFTMGRKESDYGFVYGKTGVDLFFVISGFVIYKSLDGIKSGSEFLIKRFIRLYPTYWVSISFTFLLIIFYPFLKSGHFESIDWHTYWTNFTMFQYYFKVQNIDGPYWTLIIELNFYLLVFLVLILKMSNYLSQIFLLFSTITAFLFFLNKDHFVIHGIYHFLPILIYFPLFIAGIYFHKIHTSSQNKIQNYMILIFCLILRIYFLKIDYSSGSSFLNFYEHASAEVVIFLIFVLLTLHKLKWIVNSATLFLGKISFALYLIHQYVSITYILPYTTENLGINFWIASLFIALPILITISALITFYVEIPINKQLRKLIFDRKTIIKD